MSRESKERVMSESDEILSERYVKVGSNSWRLKTPEEQSQEKKTDRFKVGDKVIIGGQLQVITSIEKLNGEIKCIHYERTPTEAELKRSKILFTIAELIVGGCLGYFIFKKWGF